MPRFVLLYHECPPEFERRSHWDLMFETGESLRTWSLESLPCNWASIHHATDARAPSCPSIAEGESVGALALSGHRVEYLNYEGPLSGERGRVFRVARGTYEIVTDLPDEWRVSLAAPLLHGQLCLRRGSDMKWQLTYRTA